LLAYVGACVQALLPSRFSIKIIVTLGREQAAFPEVESGSPAPVFAPKRIIAVAAELGIIIFDLPGQAPTASAA
jgi:hypothetical protein